MTERRSFGPVDTMWLNMDRPNNLMVIDAVMLFDEPISHARLGPLLQDRLVERYPVFAQRPVSAANPFGMPQWEDDPDFDLSRHLRRATLPAPGNLEALQCYVESRMSVPFDRSHPMWEMTLVDGFGRGCALVARFHHSIADGMALSQVLLSMTDASPVADPEERQADDHSRELPRGLAGVARGLGDTGIQVARGGLHALSRIPGLANPARAMEVLELAVKTGRVADTLLLGHNPVTPFSGVPGIEKRAVWSEPLAIADVKAVSRLSGATVNDVLVAAVSGAINTYLRDHGVDPVDLTTMVPVNVRPAGQPLPRHLGNKFALVFLKLPTGVLPPFQRVAESKRRMDWIKGSPEAVITFELNRLIGRAEPHLSNLIVDFFSNKAIGVTTNVMGPQHQRYVAGVPLTGVVSWVPGSGRQTLGVCIFSLAGMVRVGFKADAATIPDAEKLVHAFEQDMDQLLWFADRAR